MSAKKPLFIRLLPLAVLLCGLALFFALGLQEYLSLAYLRENRLDLLAWTERYGLWAVLVYVGVYAVATALSIPGAVVLSIGGGFLFGLFLGTFAAVIGATIGAVGVFLAVRTGLGNSLTKNAKGSIKKMEQGFRDDAFQYLLILRLVPLFPFFVVNIVPAMFGVSLRVFVLTTFIGIIPGGFAYVSVGHGIGAVFELGQTPGLEVLLKPEVLIPIVSLTALSLLQLVYKRMKKTREGKGETA